MIHAFLTGKSRTALANAWWVQCEVRVRVEASETADIMKTVVMNQRPKDNKHNLALDVCLLSYLLFYWRTNPK